MKDNTHIVMLNDESFQEYVENFLKELLDKKHIIKSAQSINMNSVIVIYEETI